MKEKNVGWGIALILLAVYIICYKMNFLPSIPFLGVDLVFAVILAICAVKALVKKDFFWFFICIGIIGCIYSDEFQIEEITPGILMIACSMLGVGFNMIFKKDRKTYIGPEYSSYNEYVEYESEGSETTGNEHRTINADSYSDIDEISVSNTFGEKVKYVSSLSLKSARVENSFGSLKVYFNNSTLSDSGAKLRVANCFGETVLFIPKEWRVDMKESNVLGAINVYGQSSNASDAKSLWIDVSNSFGEVSINFI